MGNWSFARDKGVVGDWPKTDSGEFVAPAFLEHVSGDSITLNKERSMLWSFGVPTVCTYPNNGELGNVVLGYAGGGVDIFVPETMLDDARNILSGTLDENFEEEND